MTLRFATLGEWRIANSRRKKFAGFLFAIRYSLFAPSFIPRRRDEGLELPLDQPGKGDAGAVVILRPDDLHADRQAFLGKADRRRGRRQIGERGVAGPEQLI